MKQSHVSVLDRLGIFSGLDEDASLPVTFTARSDVKLLLLPKSSVVGIGKRHPEFLLSLLKDSGNRIGLLTRKLRLSQFTALRQRVAGYLIDCARRG